MIGVTCIYAFKAITGTIFLVIMYYVNIFI